MGRRNLAFAAGNSSLPAAYDLPLTRPCATLKRNLITSETACWK